MNNHINLNNSKLKDTNNINIVIKFYNQNSTIQKVIEDNKDIVKSQFNRGN
jgi:hypothetical protein